MRFSVITVAIVAIAGALPLQALAQTTTVYGYDAQGRLTHSGTNNNDTTSYKLDGADNRASRRCCEAIGGAQVLDDGFDPYFYLQTYPDIRAAGLEPYQHWLQWGASENRWPNRYFNTAWYRATYGLSASVNQLTDYHNGGWQAGRNPSAGFSTTAYHAAYPDTAAYDPLWHYLRWGYGEGRVSFAL
ncbi:hypothetical protein [Brevundimonas sp.]|uniref:hypothetical protein n=1 Tax=Brevundimonas sp. TaxID=1871086 RepID=UPI003D0E8C60